MPSRPRSTAPTSRWSATDAASEQKRITAKDIPNIYPVGSEVLVQVTKGPISTKGPRITTNISLAGRYLVLMPYSDQSGISRKIESPKERERLRKILRELDLPEGMGVIIRTVGEGQRARYFVRDLGLLDRAMAGDRESDEGEARAGLRLRGAGPHRAHRARLSHRRDRRSDLRRRGRREAHDRSRRPDFPPREGPHPALHRHPADLRGVQRAEADRRRLSPPGLAAVRRLHRHRRNRGAHRHRRQYRPQQGREGRGENHAPDESGSGRRNGAPDAPAQHRRPDHRRFHRHEVAPRSAGRLSAHERPAAARQGEDARAADLRRSGSWK